MEAHCQHHRDQQPRRWPLYGLRVSTPRLELRLPDLELLDELAKVAADGVHDEASMPFTIPWTVGTPEERGRTTFQHVLSTIANWTPQSWTLSLAVLRDGRVVGRQDMTAADFAVTREVDTGSWLGLAHQGRGIGTEMRAAAVHLAFAGLGARAVTSAAMTDNPRSLAVSRKLGYRPDGLTVASVQGTARTLQRLRLDRATWEAGQREEPGQSGAAAASGGVPVRIAGLEACGPLFGL
ncbi:GNAT family N-acetyltransferase [Streptomyces sp. H27-D2]|uniref:GNAT family N-acetyltransferase n=1 Tax=Streptomyces sp. H27-D2 TaxID=3046304 RepID=UPI002DB8938B|nr:GNAT family protein [Streptomyces sp. H27-D2]MEC4018392.1 GNAT family protein [Streptomyces sp. H27-D2]